MNNEEAVKPTPAGQNAGPYSAVVPDLLEEHYQHLAQGSGLTADIIKARGYRSVLGKTKIGEVGFSTSQWTGVGILIPTFGPDGKPGSFVYRPDKPKQRDGKAVKYVLPLGAGISLDMHPKSQPNIGDPTTPLYITEGVKKGDALATHGFCAIALNGVWGFRGKNADGGVTFLLDWDFVALNDRQVIIVFDSDVTTKPAVRSALRRICQHIERKGGQPVVVTLPANADGTKVGVDDYLLQFGADALRRLVDEAAAAPPQALPPELELVDPPYRVTQPLALHDSIAYAIVSLTFRETMWDRPQADGTVVPLNSPEVTHSTKQHVICFDQTQPRLIGRLAEKLGRPQDAHPGALRQLGVEVALDDIPNVSLGWSRTGVVNFLGGHRPVLHDVFRRLVSVLDAFIDFSPVQTAQMAIPAQTVAEMVAFWVLSTYFVPAASAVGYLHIQGPSGSGKTKLLTLISRVAALGKLVDQSVTTAALKSLTSAGATLCVDEAETIYEKTFDPNKRSILLGGNRRGATVTISEPRQGKTWQPRDYNTFCPKAFASIHPFDATLASRTIRVPLVRSASVKANRDEYDDGQWPCDRDQLRDDLCAVAVLNLAEAERLYHSTTPSCLHGRDLDPWRLMLTLARLLDQCSQTTYYDQMLRLALAKHQEAQATETTSAEVWVLRALVRLVLEQQLDQLAAGTIHEKIKHLAALDGVHDAVRVSPGQIGKLVRALGLTYPGTKHHGQERVLHLNRVAVAERARAYGVPVPASPDGTVGTDGTVMEGESGQVEPEAEVWEGGHEPF